MKIGLTYFLTSTCYRIMCVYGKGRMIKEKSDCYKCGYLIRYWYKFEVKILSKLKEDRRDGIMWRKWGASHDKYR